MASETYYPRELVSRIVRALRVFPVVVLSGARQAGKSTILQRDSALSGRTYLTLDEFTTLAALKEDAGSVLSNVDTVTVDEAHKAPELFSAIKRLVDRERVPGRFLLSGSANFLLLAKLGDSLAGRACYVNLAPFSAREYERKTEKRPFLVALLAGNSVPESTPDQVLGFEANDVLRGGFPPPRLHEGDEYVDWFQGYEQTYLARDVRQLSQVADLTAFRALLRLTALRTAQVLNQSGLGRDAKLNAVTAGRYLSVQEASCLLYRLPAYHRSKTTRLVKSPKLHFCDSGLAAFLCGVDDLPPGGEEPLRGALLETYVAQNILAILAAHKPDANLFYWRERGGREVDFIVEAGRKVLAIEVKWTSRLRPRDWQGLEQFRASCPSCTAGLLAYSGADVQPLGRDIWAVPLPMLIS